MKGVVRHGSSHGTGYCLFICFSVFQGFFPVRRVTIAAGPEGCVPCRVGRIGCSAYEADAPFSHRGSKMIADIFKAHDTGDEGQLLFGMILKG